MRWLVGMQSEVVDDEEGHSHIAPLGRHLVFNFSPNVPEVLSSYASGRMIPSWLQTAEFDHVEGSTLEVDLLC